MRKSRCALIFAAMTIVSSSLAIPIPVNAQNTQAQIQIKETKLAALKGNYDESIAAATQLLAKYPKNAELLYARSYSYYKKEMFDDALQDANALVALGDDFEGYYLRGQIYHDKGEYQAAVNDYTKALSYQQSESCYSWRGLCYINLEDYQKGLDDLNKVEAMGSKDPINFCNRALCNQNLGRFESAVQDCTKALIYDPDYADAYKRRAAINLKNLNQPSQALDDLSKYIVLKKDDGDGYKLRGDAYRKLGRLREANQDYGNCLAFDPANTDAKALKDSTAKELAMGSSGTVGAGGGASGGTGGMSGGASGAQGQNAGVASTISSSSGAGSGGDQAGLVPSSEQINKPIRDKWAVIIGVGKFKDSSIHTLKYPDKDARDFYNFLITQAHFAPDHVRLLLNEDATRTRILTELGDKFLPRVAKPDDLIVVYYSSHGSPSKYDPGKSNYLIAYDSEPSNLFASGIELQELTKTIKRRCETNRVLIILDACHSGGASANAKATEPPANFDAASLMGQGQMVICSSKEDERSYESRRYQNGVFTRKLIEGLSKSGPRTKLGEAFSYTQQAVHDEVKEDNGETQNPLLKSQWNGDDIQIAAPPASPSPLPAIVKSLLGPDSSQKPVTAASSAPSKPPAKPRN